MDSEIGNIEAAESERLLSGNVVKAHIYGSKEPVCSCVCMKQIAFTTCFFRLFTRLFSSPPLVCASFISNMLFYLICVSFYNYSYFVYTRLLNTFKINRVKE